MGIPLRQHLTGAVILLAFSIPSSAFAGELGSVPIDPLATLLYPEHTVNLSPGGTLFSPVHVSNHAFLSIDFAVQSGKQLTLLMISREQKQQLEAGNPINGQPRVRMAIDGVASQSLLAEAGEYYIAVFNPEAEPVSMTYRVSARAF